MRRCFVAHARPCRRACRTRPKVEREANAILEDLERQAAITALEQRARHPCTYGFGSYMMRAHTLGLEAGS